MILRESPSCACHDIPLFEVHLSTLRFLRTFVAVARHGSFGAAANQLALTPSAVSMQMRALEAEFKHELFDRCGRSIMLNSMGKSLLPQAQQMLTLYEGMRSTAGGVEDVVGPVAIGGIESVIGSLGQAVTQLKLMRPKLDMRIIAAKSAELAQKVDAGEIDGAIIADLPGRLPASVRWTPIYSEPLVLLAHAGMPPGTISERLQSQHFIRFDRSQYTGITIDRALRKRRVKVDEFLELNSLEGIAALVRQGIGVAIVPLLRYALWTRDEELRVLPLGKKGPARSIGLLERARHDNMAVTAEIARLMQAWEP